MPFIPHTEDDTREMLAAIGAASLDELFDEIRTEFETEQQRVKQQSEIASPGDKQAA